MAYNRHDGLELVSQLAVALTRHFSLAGADDPALPLAAGARTPAARLVGSYRSVEHSRHTVMKLTALLDDTHVTAADDGAVLLHLAGAALPLRLVETAPLRFRSVDDVWQAAFQEDADGQVRALYLAGLYEYERLPWYETPAVEYGCFVCFGAAFLLALLAWPVGAARRRLRSRPTGGAPPAAAQFLVPLIAAPNLLWLLTLAGLLRGPTPPLDEGAPWWLAALAAVPLLTAALTAGLLAITTLGWRHRASSAAGRLGDILFLLIAAAFPLFLNAWNLLGFRW